MFGDFGDPWSAIWRTVFGVFGDLEIRGRRFGDPCSASSAIASGEIMETKNGDEIWRPNLYLL